VKNATYVLEKRGVLKGIILIRLYVSILLLIVMYMRNYLQTYIQAR